MFAYAAFKLGAVGNTVGYAIFNTACVVTAIVSGIVTAEWKLASPKAKNLLYTGLACMVIGILIISVGNKFASEVRDTRNANLDTQSENPKSEERDPKHG